MKKCLVVLTGVMLLLLFVPTASATYILCQGVGTQTPGQPPLTGQPVTLTCPSIIVPVNNTLTGVDLQLVNDAQGPGGVNSSLYFAWSTFVGVPQGGTQTNTETSTTGTTFNSCTGSGINSTCPTMLSYAENVTAGNTFNAVSVIVSASGNTPPPSPYNANGSASAELYIQYDYTSGVPEPATFGLIGGALLGLGVFARKRFSRP